ncbi:MAG: GntP family permease, partial [Cetobacterium sp.]
MGVLVLVVSIALLIGLSFNAVSILLIAPLLSGGLMAVTGDMQALSALTGPFMSVTASYIKSYFLIFLGGAIFGEIMGKSGAADSISHFISKNLGKERAILAVVFATAILTYGGVSLFVVVFAVYPLAKSMFKEGDIPKRLIPGTIALGAFTFTMTAMPGSPQFINSMPTNSLGTNIYAAPILGIIASAFILVCGMIWLNYRADQAKKAGEGYGQYDDESSDEGQVNLPSISKAFAPIITIFITNWMLIKFIFSKPSVVEYFKPFGGVDGNWPVTIALAFAILVAIVIFKSRIKNLK